MLVLSKTGIMLKNTLKLATSLRGASGKWGWDEREQALLSDIPQGSNGGVSRPSDAASPD